MASNRHLVDTPHLATDGHGGALHRVRSCFYKEVLGHKSLGTDQYMSPMLVTSYTLSCQPQEDLLSLACWVIYMPDSFAATGL